MSKRLKRTMRMARVVMYKETLIDFNEHLWTFIGSFLGVGIIGFLSSYYLQGADTLFLVGSFGASSVLIYGVINSPLAQPRNLIGGHVICALVGVTLNYLITEPCPESQWAATWRSSLVASLETVTAASDMAREVNLSEFQGR